MQSNDYLSSQQWVPLQRCSFRLSDNGDFKKCWMKEWSDYDSDANNLDLNTSAMDHWRCNDLHSKSVWKVSLVGVNVPWWPRIYEHDFRVVSRYICTTPVYSIWFYRHVVAPLNPCSQQSFLWRCFVHSSCLLWKLSHWLFFPSYQSQLVKNCFFIFTFLWGNSG